MTNQKRQNGIYYTPNDTALYMVEKSLDFLNTIEPKILEPCFGSGIFVENLLKAGINNKSIVGYDLHPKFNHLIDIRKEDFLKNESKELFDLIIMNPPYKSKRKSEYIKNNKEFLIEKFGEDAILNLYIPFIIKAERMLLDNGILTIIVQDAFLTNKMYTNFRKYILNNFQIELGVLAPKGLFKHADINPVILVLRKNKNKRREFLSVDRVMQELNLNNPKRGFIVNQDSFTKLLDFKILLGHPQYALDFVKQLFKENKPVSYYYQGGTGISTGNDKKYIQKNNEQPNNSWVRFYKNPGGHRYYKLSNLWIERDFVKYKSKKFLVRNYNFQFNEGVTCSSMGVKFSAVLLPEGSVFGINTSLFHENKYMLLYLLAFLNTNLCTYILRGYLNRTNMVTASYVKKLPLIVENEYFNEIVKITDKIISELKTDSEYDFNPYRERVEELFNKIYKINTKMKKEIDRFTDKLLKNI